MVAKRRHWPGIRPLEAVIECPTLLQDGTVLQTPGYDVGSGIFYIPHAEFPPIPEGPSLEDAKAAVTVILDVVKDFPFKDEDHRHAWLSGFLTPFARHAIAGPTPFFLGDANSSGAASRCSATSSRSR